MSVPVELTLISFKYPWNKIYIHYARQCSCKNWKCKLSKSNSVLKTSRLTQHLPQKRLSWFDIRRSYKRNFYQQMGWCRDYARYLNMDKLQNVATCIHLYVYIYNISYILTYGISQFSTYRVNRHQCLGLLSKIHVNIHVNELRFFAVCCSSSQSDAKYDKITGNPGPRIIPLIQMQCHVRNQAH